MRILIGAVTNTEAIILQAHLKALVAQELPSHVEVDYWFIADPDLSEDSLQLFKDHDMPVDFAGPKPLDAEYAVSEETHHWNKPTFYWLGQQKQRILERGKGYDAVFMCDTDLIMDAGTLASLINTNKDIVSAVFWTKWSPEMPSLPQVWMEQPYEMQGKGLEAHEHLENAATRQLWKVGGLGACTLIKSSTLNRVAYSPPLSGLPEDGMWQGEDRSFCIRAQRAHIDLWADGWPSVFHVYRPSDIPKIPVVERNLFESRRNLPRPGDYVSARLTPVEEGHLAGWCLHYRGRLGSDKLLRGLDNALGQGATGDSRFIQIKFPIWWEVAEYRGATKTIRVEILDVRQDLAHPTRDDEEDYGVYYDG